VPRPSELQATLIAGISDSYALLQASYAKWASSLADHEDALRHLSAEGIAVDRIQRQSTFNMHSSHWNKITVPILKKIATEDFSRMQRNFESVFAETPREECRMVWYLLFFIHPVRHELYFFDGHYPEGYDSRLYKLLRSHRMGLRAARTYLSDNRAATARDAFMKACGTTALKHLLLHPTTEGWHCPEADAVAAIRSLSLRDDDFSPEEMIAIALLSQAGSLQFDQWISYAPCAINEGPLFTARTGVDVIESYDGITSALASDDATQSTLRECLQSCYNIRELKES
jgi:hypothetical protein